MQALVIAVGVVIAALSVLSQTQLWQRKEYRWDRFVSWLRSPEGIAALLPYPALAAVVIDIGWVAFMANQSTRADLLGWVALGLFAMHHGRRIVKRGVFRPDMTVKAVTVMAVTALITGVYVWLTFTPALLPALQIATMILFIPFFTIIAVAVVNVPFEWKKHQVIKNAAAKRQALTKLTVIGITGSYGKTSTKYFLEQLLLDSGKQVIATHEHRNDAYPVALDFFARVTDKTTIYIAEMAAYRRGEIKRIAQMLRPQIGVLTAIGNQHLDLFGSLGNIAAAKWELIQALPNDGIAVLNADNESVVKKAVGYQGKIIWYSTKKSSDVWVSDVAVKPEHIEATLHVSETLKRSVRIPLASDGMLSSVLGAVAAAMAAGADPEHIFARVQTLKPFAHIMEVIRGKNGATIIDNSYSANEAGVMNALEHLKRFSQTDKRIVLLPVIELGAAGLEVNKHIAEVAAATGAPVYIIKPTTDPRQLVKEVTKDLTSESVVLLEGRVPSILVQSLRV